MLITCFFNLVFATVYIKEVLHSSISLLFFLHLRAHKVSRVTQERLESPVNL